MIGLGGFVLIGGVSINGGGFWVCSTLIGSGGGFIVCVGPVSGGGFIECVGSEVAIEVGVGVLGTSRTAPTEAGFRSTGPGLSLGSERTPQDKASVAGSTRIKGLLLFFMRFIWGFLLFAYQSFAYKQLSDFYRFSVF
jgi:hypothetical protein